MSEKVKLDFYALGKYNNNGDSYKMGHNGFVDTANNIIERNSIYLNNAGIDIKDNIKKYAVLNEADKNTNNYLEPIKTYNIKGKHKPSSNLTSLELFKEKAYSNEANKVSLNEGRLVNKEDYKNKKVSESMTQNEAEKNQTLNSLILKNQFNHRGMIRKPKTEGKTIYRSVSKEAPEWFHITNETQMKNVNDIIAKEESIRVFSRFTNWITVSPKSKSRKHAFEKNISTNMQNRDKVIPKWMQQPIDKTKIPEHKFKPIEYLSSDNAKSVMLVDKDINDVKNIKPNKSIFSIMDYRHDIRLKEEADIYSSRVKQEPKKFFDWDDGKPLNPYFRKIIY